MTELRMDAPNEKQRRFLLDRHRHIAYGGARGGGKSWAVRTKAKLLALRYAGIKLLIVRRTLRELQNNHIDPLRQELAGVAKYKAADKRFEFPNGSVLTFGYCACDGDLGQYQGAEYDVVFLDEAGQLQKAWIDAINACVRGTNGFPKRTYYTLNPGGPSHGYFKRLFIDRRFEPGEREDAYSFVQALVTDNRVLLERQPDYLQQLETLPPKLREAWLHGSWDVYEGQFFEDFRDVPEHYRDRRWTHVIEPFAPDKGWTVCRSYDFGYGKPFSCAWWAVDYDGVLYRILELYGCTRTPNEGVKWTPDRQFAEIRDRGGLVGLNFCADQLGEQTFDGIARHLDHYLSLGGEHTVALGCDLDGTSLPDGWGGIEVMERLYEALARQNVAQDVLDRVFFSNCVDFFASALTKGGAMR